MPWPRREVRFGLRTDGPWTAARACPQRLCANSSARQFVPYLPPWLGDWDPAGSRLRRKWHRAWPHDGPWSMAGWKSPSRQRGSKSMMSRWSCCCASARDSGRDCRTGNCVRTGCFCATKSAWGSRARSTSRRLRRSAPCSKADPMRATRSGSQVMAVHPSPGLWPSTFTASGTRSSYYYFSSGVSFFQIPDRLRDFTQAVAPVNHRLYLTGFNEFAQDVQVGLARLSQHHDEALTYESRQENRFDHTNQRTEQATVRSSDHDATPLGL